MEKTRTTPNDPKAGKSTAKMPSSKGHKAMHPEREIPDNEPANRADILPATHIDDDPESYRLT